MLLQKRNRVAGPTVSVGEEIEYSDIVEHRGRPLDEGYKKLPAFTGDRGFDPRPVLESLDLPGLWLLGENDRSIPTPATVAILDELGHGAGRLPASSFPEPATICRARRSGTRSPSHA